MDAFLVSGVPNPRPLPAPSLEKAELGGANAGVLLHIRLLGRKTQDAIMKVNRTIPGSALGPDKVPKWLALPRQLVLTPTRYPRINGR